MIGGYISKLESFATHDGAGIRCAVFFQGCAMRCVCCHNPETWAIHSGNFMTAEELVAKIVRFKPYFGRHGGVTLTGGEPLLQPDFLREIVALLNEKGIHTLLDTAGQAPVKASGNESGTTRQAQILSDILGQIDGVILDIKYATELEYQKYTGGSLLKALTFLHELDRRCVPVWIRTVIIPNMNDKESNMEKYAALLRGIHCIRKVELLAFHTLGFSKYQDLHIPNTLEGLSALQTNRLDELQAYLDDCLADPL